MTDRLATERTLRAAGFVAAEDEAAELVAAAASADDLAAMVARRLAGEPTAWITGRTTFLGIPLHIEPGVYVPRWKTEALARHALAHLSPGGFAVDLGTGCGAIAAFLAHHAHAARVVATDIDPRAVACARRNGVEAFAGDLFDPLPRELQGHVDVIASVPPYVPEPMLAFLARDVVAHEPRGALEGGADGLDVAARIVDAAPRWLRPGGALVVEVGVDQVAALTVRMADAGLVVHEVLYDGDGDASGVCAASERTRSSMRS
ncbi:MAG TPA: HemK/PrmC family methyltransferase [Acidimicrobiales bacterium]